MAEELTKLEFTLEDELDGKKLSPTNVDFPTLLDFLGDVKRLVLGNRTTASLADSRIFIEEGSLKALPFVAVLLASNFESEMAKLERTGDLDGIEKGRAEIIEKWQTEAQKHPRRVYYIGATNHPHRISIVNGNHGFQHKSENAWVPVEKYLTGILEDVGGKQTPNLHLSLPETRDTYPVAATKEQLGARQYQLYKTMTVFVGAEQHLITKRYRNIRLLEFIKADVAVDEEALGRLWQHGSEAWRDVGSASRWLDELRGN